MCPPFIINVAVRSIQPERHLVWKEIGWGDKQPLDRFFSQVLADNEKALARADGKKWSALSADEKGDYNAEATRILFSLRKFYGFGIHQVLPWAARLASPLRLFRSSKNIGRGLFGYHVGILRSTLSNRILGVSALEKTGEANEAELSYWKHPCLERAVFLASVQSFMSWSWAVANYSNFLSHVEAPTSEQRGNNPALLFAKDLGFEPTGIREADDPNGNGKRTVVLRTRNWK